ncbi:MAG TPA: hypothetical protein VFD05_03590 [Bacilli bacterium]|nr:hypothetical protein [Bacilli bacterium]
MTDVFKNILDDDEVVIKQFKPNKFRFFFGTYGTFLLIMLFLGGFVVAPLAFDGEVFIGYVFIGIVVGVFVLALLLTTLFAVLSYQKKYYAYTNKRILIQGGIIGVDYKGLDHKMIGAIEVRVDLLDKIVRKNTGTIKFGSQASPLSKQAVPMFIFNGIYDPYNVYREIKKYIDSVKQ